MTSDLVPARNSHLATLAAEAARQIRHGRPVRLAARLLVAVAIGALAVAAVGWQPASLAIITGALTWLLLTGRRDLAARRARRAADYVAQMEARITARNHARDSRHRSVICNRLRRRLRVADGQDSSARSRASRFERVEKSA